MINRSFNLGPLSDPFSPITGGIIKIFKTLKNPTTRSEFNTVYQIS